MPLFFILFPLQGIGCFLSFIHLLFMLEFTLRENMRLFKRFFLFALFMLPTVVGAQVATTAGNNLTAWNGNSGATNNNNWNQLMNNRTMAEGGPVNAVPAADFGNCNSLILRCAQPKCSGCTTIDIARPIVTGCVNSNDSCKKYGDDLIEFISAQMVSNVNAKAQQQELAAQAAAQQAAAAQSNAQIQQMQAQMQQMQYDMQQQNAQQLAQMQAALDEQKALTQQALEQQSNTVSATLSVPSGNGALTDAQVAAAEQGVAADILARQQISGQVMSKIEGAEVALKALKATMNNAFEYAGCDLSGNNCTGPKRVKVFKQKALQFFDPYNDVLDELYDALITAQAVGVDITDIYMMLNGSCNVWGEYLCSDTARERYGSENCVKGKSVSSATTNGGHECYEGQTIPAEDSPACVLQRTLKDQEEVQRNWLYAEAGEDDMIRVGCASAALETSAFFRNRKKQATIDIETLERIIEQDAPAIFGGNGLVTNTKPYPDGVKYCAITSNNYQELQRAASTKTLPKKICVADKELERILGEGMSVASDERSGDVTLISLKQKCADKNGADYMRCLCRDGGVGNLAYWDAKQKKCACEGDGYTFNHEIADCVNTQGVAVGGVSNANVSTRLTDCKNTGGEINISALRETYGDVCVCNGLSYNPDVKKCSTGLFNYQYVENKNLFKQ